MIPRHQLLQKTFDPFDLGLEKVQTYDSISTLSASTSLMLIRCVHNVPC